MPYSGQTTNNRILVVEDDARIVRMLRRFLGARNYTLRGVEDALSLTREVDAFQPDLVLLDWNLPGLPGIEALRALRAEPSRADLPVIMVTARGDEIDRVEGLLTGADDYVVKPFSLAELEARISSVLRRHQRIPAAYADDHLQVFPDRKSIRVAGKSVALSLQEWALLTELLNCPEGLSRETLVERVWGGEHAVNKRSIDVMVMRLRRVLEKDPAVPRYIVTERGMGYRFHRKDQLATHR